MIIKLEKTLNTKKEFTLISFTMDDNIDNVILDKFKESNCNIYETNENYYYYIEDIIDIDNSEKFKVKTRKGDIVSLTARDNTYIIFPSKKSFAFAFDLNYTKVLKYVYEEVLLDGKPYEVKYVTDKDDKINDGVVYTLSQLISYVSTLIKGYIYRSTARYKSKKENEIINRILIKHYSAKSNEISKIYELNVKKVGLNENNKWVSTTIKNVTKSNKYLYDYYLIRMFAYMILTKSKSDIENKKELRYCFLEKFETIEDVYCFLEINQDIVNNFFIETKILFEKPNDMFTSYAPFINGVYMFYEYNSIKTYLYRSIDEKCFNEKSLKPTYVSTKYKHKIKGIKNIYNV